MMRLTDRHRHDLGSHGAGDLSSGSPMTNRANHVDASGFIAQSEIDELFGNANPNPDRIGCPPPKELPALARRERPIDDPAYDHLADCSACYRKVRGLQQARARQRAIEWSNR